MTDRTCHGLTYAQWLTIWDRLGWREHLHDTLIDVASSKDALADDRISALQFMNEAVLHGLLPTEPSFAEFATEVLIQIAKGSKRRCSKMLQHRMSERLAGAQALLRTGRDFLNSDSSVMFDVGRDLPEPLLS